MTQQEFTVFVQSTLEGVLRQAEEQTGKKLPRESHSVGGQKGQRYSEKGSSKKSYEELTWMRITFIRV
jgi:hypothetical protein